MILDRIIKAIKEQLGVKKLSSEIDKKVKKLEKIKRSSIKEFRDRDFSEYCEYVVAFKLQELGWGVYQPLSDRYIDIVAVKKINGKEIMRTIQVKGSRIEKEGAQLSYGLTHKPKDLMQDHAHFFIWLFYDKEEKENFIILSVSDFIELMGLDFFKSMSWRKGNCRIHFSADIQNNRLKNYLNKWNNLRKGGKPNTADLCISAQEVEDSWKSKNATEKWRETNSRIIKQIPPEMMERIRRKTEVEE